MLDTDDQTPLDFLKRGLQELEISKIDQTQEQEDKVRLSVYFILAYLGYLLISLIILKCISDFDLIMGLVRFMRKTNSSMGCIKATTIVYLLFFILCPIIIGAAWSIYLYDKSSDNDSVVSAAIFLMLLFSTFVLLGAVVWYGAKWHVSRAVIVFFVLGALSAWLFTFASALTKDNYTYSGVSAILLATNFLPACYILQKKTVWKDIPLQALFRALAKKIADQTQFEHDRLKDMSPIQRRDHADKSLSQTIGEITAQENRNLCCKFLIAFIAYCASMGLYLGVLVGKEDDNDTVQGLAFLNPLFILVSDIVVLSLREQSVQIRSREEKGSFIYSTAFQSMVLLFNRALLCYNKEYWLMNLALVYFLVQCICAYDATQTIFLKSDNMRDEQEDMIELLRICPVLQAKVQNQLPELKTSFEFVKPGCCCDFGKFCQWRKFRTQVASFLFFCFFSALNYWCSTEPADLETEKVKFYNDSEVGQWVYGYFAIAASIVLVFYILWYRSFKNSGYVFTCGAMFLYILLQAVSVGVGVFFYEEVGGNNDLILTSFVLLPIIVVTFSAFFGIWVSNDFNGYEMDYLQSKNFKPEEIEAYNELGWFSKMTHGAWRPRTRKDWVFFFMLVINMITILAFFFSTIVMFKPAYVGITISTLILVFELSFIFIWKYRATNANLTVSVVVPMLLSVCIMLTWVVYIVFEVILDEDEPTFFQAGAIFISIVYFVMLISSLLYFEFHAVDRQVSRLSCSFWILFGLTFLILIGVGGAAITFTDYGLGGIIWISVCIYALLNVLLKRYRKAIAVLFALMFLLAGVFLLVTSDDNTQSFQGISVLYFGMFILSFGSFVYEYIKNKFKQRKSIFMNAPEVLPMLEYNLDTRQMKDRNAEPMLFFFCIYVVLIWAFSTTIIADKSWRYIPLSIIGIALAFSYIYIIEKQVNATTVDRKLFKQATALFYTSCLVTATEYKQKWRNTDRDIKNLSGIVDLPDQFESQEYRNKMVYRTELEVLKDWSLLIGTYKKDMGFIGFFESLSKKPNKVKPVAILPHPRPQVRSHTDVTQHNDLLGGDQSYINVSENDIPGDNQAPNHERYISITGDEKLKELEERLRKSIGKQTKQGEMIDAWSELLKMAREEDYYEKKFWAFLNGYLNLKMAQLLDNELSIVETSVRMYIRDLKQKSEGASAESIKENMGVGKFLDELKDEPDLLVGFSIFIAEEFLKDPSLGVITNDSIEKVEDIANDSMILAPDWNQPSQLKQNIEKLRNKYGPQSGASFSMEAFQKDQQDLIANLLLERSDDIMRAVSDSRKRDEDRDRRRRAADEARRYQQEQMNMRRNIKMDEVQQVGTDEDERMLKLEGDSRLNALRGSGLSTHDDYEFHAGQAIGELQGNYEYIRAQEVQSSENHQDGSETQVFADGVSANDIRQGGLGDCYLLSALSIIAHSRPELIQKIFHPESRIYRFEGIYSIMLYNGKVPTVVTVDDKFLVNQLTRKHAFVRLCTDPSTNSREIWPLLVEKAYAKFHGSYSNIEGGLVHTALEELTNGAGQSYKLRDKEIEQMFNTGELWTKMLFWRSRSYLMGAGSPPGSDSDVSPLGIVQGHAYSILDVATIDGHNLVQLRNPWGDETEWKGDWGDKSDMWNERRKKSAYERMKLYTGRVEEIGKADGIFWMSFNDFYRNFDQISLCRFFDKEYTEIFFESEWNLATATAGGCSNYDSVGYNPQIKLHVDARKNSSTPIEVFIQLNIQGVSSQDNKTGIGFEMYELKGKKVQNRRLPPPKFTNDGGYKITNSVTFDGAIKDTGSEPLTILISTFKPNVQAKFRFTVHFKHQQGTVTLEKFGESSSKNSRNSSRAQRDALEERAQPEQSASRQSLASLAAAQARPPLQQPQARPAAPMQPQARPAAPMQQPYAAPMQQPYSAPALPLQPPVQNMPPPAQVQLSNRQQIEVEGLPSPHHAAAAATLIIDASSQRPVDSHSPQLVQYVKSQEAARQQPPAPRPPPPMVAAPPRAPPPAPTQPAGYGAAAARGPPPARPSGNIPRPPPPRARGPPRGPPRVPRPPAAQQMPAKSMEEQLKEAQLKMQAKAEQKAKVEASGGGPKPAPKAPAQMSLAEQLQAQQKIMRAKAEAKEKAAKEMSSQPAAAPNRELSLAEQLQAQQRVMRAKAEAKEKAAFVGGATETMTTNEEAKVVGGSGNPAVSKQKTMFTLAGKINQALKNNDKTSAAKRNAAANGGESDDSINEPSDDSEEQSD